MSDERIEWHMKETCCCGQTAEYLLNKQREPRCEKCMMEAASQTNDIEVLAIYPYGLPFGKKTAIRRRKHGEDH